MKILSRRKRGFTLIEMTIVLFIISLLILIIIPNISNVRKSANGIHSNAMTSVVQSQVDSYLEANPKRNNGQVSYEDLTKPDSNGQVYLTDKQKAKADDENIKIDTSNHAVVNTNGGDHPKASTSSHE